MIILLYALKVIYTSHVIEIRYPFNGNDVLVNAMVLENININDFSSIYNYDNLKSLINLTLILNFWP